MSLETRKPTDTHHRSRRTAPQESGDNSPQRGGMPQPKNETTEHFRKPHPHETHDPAAFKHHPRTRTKAPPQRRLLTSVLCPKTAMYRKNRTKHVRALTTQRSHVQGRFSMAICIRCRLSNTWLELKLINFGDGQNFSEVGRGGG